MSKEKKRISEDEFEFDGQSGPEQGKPKPDPIDDEPGEQPEKKSEAPGVEVFGPDDEEAEDLSRQAYGAIRKSSSKFGKGKSDRFPKRPENFPEDSKKQKTKEEFSAYFPGLVDVCIEKGKPIFLVKVGDELVLKENVEAGDGTILKPPPKEKLPWVLPRAKEVIQYYKAHDVESVDVLDRELFEDLVKYHQSISDLPDPEYYHLISAWVLHTYLQEQFEYSPILCFYSAPGHGKTRTGKGITYVSWRGIHVESLLPAYIFRVAERMKSTIFFDVMDMWEKAEKSGGSDIVLLRIEKGAKVPRVLYPDRGAFEDTEFFSVFGPTIIGTNESVHHILETRAIQINMRPTAKRFDDDVKEANAQSLKERLTAFRARHFDHLLPEVVKPAMNRLGDILRPIRQMYQLACPELEESFLNLVKKIEAEKRQEKSETLDGTVFKAVLELESQLENGILSVKKITERVNEILDKSDNRQFSSARIGKVLASLGFKKTATRTGAAAILWDEGLIDRLQEQYRDKPPQ